MTALNINQIYTNNPLASLVATDLLYIGHASVDGAIQFQNIAIPQAQVTGLATSLAAKLTTTSNLNDLTNATAARNNLSLGVANSPTFAGLTLTAFTGVIRATAGVLNTSTIVNADLTVGSFTNITGVGTLTTGTWNATVIAGLYGGTGISNNGKTITLAGNIVTGGNLTTAGAFNSTFTMTGDTNVTFPTSGTLLTTANIVLTLQGTANQVLVNGTSGSPQIGAITLTLPQDIGFANSPTFAGMTLTAFSGVIKAAAGVLSAAAIINSDLVVGSFTNITAVGTLTGGTWNATAVAGQYGGTGIANTGKTITLGGSLTTSGAFASTFTMTGVTNVTFPTSGILLTSASVVSSLQGTASQILVNGTAGSAQTGAIILTLPQNIATTSTPSFQQLTLSGSSSAASIGLRVQRIDATTYTAYFDSGIGIGVTPRVDACLAIRGTYQTTSTNPGFGVIIDTHLGAVSGTIPQTSTLYLYHNADSNSGTITAAQTLYIGYGASTGTVTTATNLYVEQPAFGTTPICANLRGLVRIGEALGTGTVNLQINTFASGASSGVAGAGGAQGLPSNPVTWAAISINGINMVVPCYSSLLI